jgi:DNA-binding transcriptional MerR regulator
MAELRIGAVARQAGVGVQTLHYYEREGLLAAPRREASGYRVYDEEVIQRVRWIKSAQGLGFSLVEIRELLALVERPHTKRGDIRERAKEKVADLNEKIASLTAMRDALCALVKECNGGVAPLEGCPILKALEAPPSVEPCSTHNKQRSFR